MSDTEEKIDEHAGRWLELAKIAQESHFNRRALEWRLTLGLFGAIGGVTYAICSLKLAAPNPWLLGVVCAAVWFLSLLYLIPIQDGHWWDHQFFVHYTKKARGLDSKCPEDRKGESIRQRWKRNTWVWLWAHWIFLGAFLLLAWVAIVYLHPGADSKPVLDFKFSI